jgi:hypothetical protein
MRSELEKGDEVKWSGHHGYFTYKGPWDSEVAMVYGGSKDPDGQRQYHAARYDELKLDTRRTHKRLVAERKDKIADRRTDQAD